MIQTDSVDDKNAPLSAAAAPSQDGSPLTDTPVLSKLSALQSDVSSQQFKSPRLQQLLGNRIATAGSLNSSTDMKSSDGVVPGENEAGSPEVCAIRKSDNGDETVNVAEV